MTSTYKVKWDVGSGWQEIIYTNSRAAFLAYDYLEYPKRIFIQNELTCGKWYINSRSVRASPKWFEGKTFSFKYKTLKRSVK